MSRLSKAAKKGFTPLTGLTGGLNALTGYFTGYGSKPGEANPFGVPNLDFLKNPIDLTKNFKPIDTTASDATFKDLLTNIGGQNQNDTEALNNLLNDINIQGNNTVGATKSDFLDRGLGGPGQISDIEANAIAQNRADTGRTAANARTTTVGKGLDRLATAYGTKYAGSLDTAKTNAATFNDLLKAGGLATADASGTYAKLLADLYSGGEKNRIDTAQPGYLDNFLRNISLNVGVGK
jgi:hypothetical protein